MRQIKSGCGGLSRIVILLGCCLFPLIWQGPDAAAGQEIVIGEINPRSGHLAKHGAEIHEGILYAVEEANSRGGLGGYPLRLISRDDQSKPEVAINQAQNLIHREKVVGLLGGYVDSLVGPISELAAKYRVPYVASASLQRSLTARKNPYFFRVSRLDGLVRPLCQFTAQAMKAKRVAILHTATPGSAEFAATVKSCLEKAGVAVPLVEKFRTGCPDFSVFLLKIKQAKVDVLISGGFYADNLILVRQMQEGPLGLRAFVAPWGVAYQSFIAEMGRGAEGLFGTCAWNPGITLPGTERASQTFVEGFRQRFGQVPNTTTMHGYTSARALLAAIEAVLTTGVKPTGEAISQALRELDLSLPMERLKFDEYGDPRFYQQVVVQIQGRQMVPVYPLERATGQVDESLARR